MKIKTYVKIISNTPILTSKKKERPANKSEEKEFQNYKHPEQHHGSLTRSVSGWETVLPAVNILPEDEREKILCQFNNTHTPYPGNKTIYELFLHQVEKTPDRIALVCVADENSQDGELSMTYRHLHEKAQRLSRRLLAAGVTQGSIVAISAGKNAGMIIGLLGILKIGCCYLPLNNDYPAERKKYILEDCAVQLLLTDNPGLSPNAEEYTSIDGTGGIYKINLEDEINDKDGLYGIEDIGGIVGNSRDLAYIMYTSGSTGKPKGVMVEHGNVVRLVINTDYIRFNVGDRLLQTGALEFDASTFEIWGSLLNGLTLVLAPTEMLLNASSLKKILHREIITSMWMTSHYFNRMSDDDIELFKPLKYVLVGGDALSSHHTRRIKSHCAGLNIINGYGPTENTTFSTTHRLKENDGNNIPIGKPIANSTAFILDKQGYPLPIGAEGELFVGGDGVSRGYLNNPTQTAEKFIRCPGALEPYAQSERLYKTGDMARWMPDGNIEFMGRMDRQVKIRGFRIETGEIEYHILMVPGVSEALVIPIDGDSGEKYLCAYIVTPHKTFDTGAVRAYLVGKLPDYMVPSYILTLDKIPLNCNGKVDQPALPKPVINGKNHYYAAPRDYTEKKLTAIWSAVLGIKEDILGIDDNFFERGGHSIKAAQAGNLIRRDLGADVSMHHIFQNPTIRLLAQYVKQSGKTVYSPITPAPARPFYPQTPAQKRMYLVWQQDQNSILYNLPFMELIHREISVQKLEQTVMRLIERHESLRTSFHIEEGQAVQKVHDADPNHCSLEYYSVDEDGMIHPDSFSAPGNSSKTGGISSRELMEQFIRPFNLEEQPLFRIGFIAITAKTGILMLDIHHIIADGTSLAILLKEIWASYDDRQLHPPAAQYKDYTLWLYDEERQREIKQQGEFWRSEFADEISPMVLPYDFPRPARQSREGESIRFDIGPDETRQLRELAQRQDGSLYIVLLAILNVLFSKLGGGEDIVLGTATAGRNHIDAADIIGMFVNTLAIRNFPAGEKKFNTFLAEVKERALCAFQNQDYPFEELAAAIGQRHESGRNPVFDIMFGLENDADRPECLLEVLTLAPTNPYTFKLNRARFDITLLGVETPYGVQFNLEYCTALFKRETIERFTGYLKHIVSSVCSDHKQTIADIDILSEGERELLLYGFNKAGPSLHADKTLYDLFAGIAIKNSDHTAVCGNGYYLAGPGKQEGEPPICYMSLTYKELDKQAGLIALYLRHLGVGPDSIVALEMEKSIETIIAILGILRAGGAYLPIDPTYPRERIDFMVKDSGAAIILERHNIYRVPASWPTSSMSMSTSIPPVHTAGGFRQVSPLAYIIYTSGTTGKPKGIMINQSTVPRVVKDTDYIDIRIEDRILQLSNYAFDGSIFDIFGALLNGSVLVLLGKDDAAAVDRLAGVIKREAISLFFITTALFNAIVDYDVTCLSGTRKVLFGGENASPVHTFNALNCLGERRIVNCYGPTETTVFATVYGVIRCSEGEKDCPIPIGRQITGSTIYILDKYLKPVPMGVTGEIYIGGECTARGYLNRPQLTAEKFIPDPFNTAGAGGTMYRSGDLARYLPDGNILYEGRIDQQVKIRGFRIELGEIEKQLLLYPGIAEAAVKTWKKENTGDLFLCAYIVCKPGRLNPGDDTGRHVSLLREYLSHTLPAYMIPHYITPLDSLPLTPNGKLNSRALPEPVLQSNNETSTSPRDHIEKKLQEIWAETLLLDKDSIGCSDNFFSLGGHSLKAMIMITAIHKALDVKLVLNDVFEKPTITQLGDYIKTTSPDTFSHIMPSERKEYYPLTSAQERLYFMSKLEQSGTLYNMPIIDIFHRNTGIEQLQAAAQFLVRRHESLRTSFRVSSGKVVQEVSPYEAIEPDLKVEYYETREDGWIYTRYGSHGVKKQKRVYFQELVKRFIRPFDLSRAPLIRVGFIKIGDFTRILMLDMHHIISDGVSMGILLDELWRYCDGKKPAPVKLQYKDYAEWLNSGAQQQRIQKQGEYWLSVFDGEVPVLHLPQDRPRLMQSNFAGDTVPFEISMEINSALQSTARGKGGTPFMIYLALYNILLAKLGGQEDIVVGTVTAGRNHADLHDIVGMFADTLALRNAPSGEKNFTSFLDEVKENALAAFENGEYPFEQLVKRLGLREENGRNPLFNVFFEIENGDNRPEYLLEVLMADQLGAYGYRHDTAKFDLSLVGVETRDGMRFKLEYNTSLFDSGTIERFILYFKQIAAAAAANPNVPIRDIDLMSAEEKYRVLVEFNAPDVPYPHDKTISHLFVEQAHRLPNAIALHGKCGRKSSDFDDGDMVSVTYAQLNTWANRLALYLREEGVVPGAIVALKAERYAESITCILGILAAGGVYMPIDPAYPGKRTAYMSADSNASYHLAIENITHLLDTEESGFFFPSPLLPELPGPAYIIYTSGSTGKPKGTLIGHRSLINAATLHADYYNLKPGDHVSQYAPLGFDASILEIFPALLSGSTLYIIDETIKTDLLLLNRSYETYDITVGFLPTPMAEQFMELENRSLRALLTGGDKLTKFVQKGYRLYNNYGPTENTVVTSIFCVDRPFDNIPIGKPVRNVRILIVDTYGALRPAGLPGEMCISGAGLAVGYINNPELTAEKYVKFPTLKGSINATGQRYLPDSPPIFYKTGDMARWLPDGNIEFLGRVDNQVKIRGCRIETGEIESRLLGEKSIAETAVTARGTGSGRYLCAYVIPALGQFVDIAACKEKLAETLPAFMIPAFFAVLEKWPLTPNGKIDRRALPEPGITSMGKEYRSPSNEVEHLLALTWAEVLGIPRVGIDDDFFELGGDSIKTILVAGRLQSKGLKLHINDIFNLRTIARLSPKVQPIHGMNSAPAKKLAAPGPVKSNNRILRRCIRDDYGAYLEQIKQEPTPDITPRNHYKEIMLTGATGYLGAFLLHELLEQTEALLHLPIRAVNLNKAEERLKQKLSFYFGSAYYGQNKNRIHVFPADLSRAGLGVPGEFYMTLAGTVDAVVHSAALVKHYGADDDFYKHNAAATRHVLDFAQAGKKKDVHYISTIDTGRGRIPGRDYLVFTEYTPDMGQEIQHLYIKSKQQAEKLVLNSRAEGIAASIYRVGNVTFHSATGGFQENIGDNTFYSIVKLLIKVGCLWENMKKLEFDLSFVDYTAKAIVQLLVRKHLLNRTYHVCNPNRLPLPKLVGILEENGLVVPRNVEKGIIDGAGLTMKNRENARNEELIQRIALDSWAWDEDPGTVISVKSDMTRFLLRRLGIRWPRIQASHIKKMIDYGKTVGFF